MKSYKTKSKSKSTEVSYITLYQDSLTFRQDELLTELIDSITGENNKNSKLSQLLNPTINPADSKHKNNDSLSLSALSLIKELFASGIAKKFLAIILTLPDGTPLADAAPNTMTEEETNYLINNLSNSTLMEVISDFFSLNPQIMNLLKDFSNLLELMPTKIS